MTAVAERPQVASRICKFARMGPRKLRRVADAIRGKSVREALVLLQFSGVFASEPLEKLLKSAVANAENNHNMSATVSSSRRSPSTAARAAGSPSAWIRAPKAAPTSSASACRT